MKRKLSIAGLVVLLLIAGMVVWFFASMGQPLYRPGMVRAEKNLRGPLEPPEAQEGDRFWSVEPDIRLHHFSIGQGRPVLVIHGGPGYPLRLPLQDSTL